MGKMIYLSECKDETVLRNFKKLKSNVPAYLKDDAECNPFILYIETVGKINEELLDFLYHSDFLSVITEQTLPTIKTFYDRGAAIEWFYLMQKIFEEFEDKADEYVVLILECFESQEDVEIVEDLLEACGASNIDVFRKKIEKYRKKASDEKKVSSMDVDTEELENKYLLLKKEKEQLSVKYEDVCNTLQSTYKVVLGNKEQEEAFKLEIEALKKSNALKDRYILHEKTRNTELISKIQEMEDAYDTLLEEVADLKKELETALEDSKRSHGEQLELPKDQVHVSEVGTDNSEEDFYFDDEDERAWSDALDSLKYDEDYTEVSFAYDETEDAVETDMQGNMEKAAQQEMDAYDYTDVAEIVPDKETVKRKCNWFFGNFFNHSKNNFLKKSRKEQENLIFIKMMEAHLPIDSQKAVRKALTNSGGELPCFELYKLICKKPTNDELMSFLSGVQANVSDE